MYLNQIFIDPRLCFVAMPFRSNLQNIYDAVEQVVKDCGMRCVRADKIARSDRIGDDIQENIKSARLVIADLTDNNPNVFYEIGLAHGCGKRVILLVQDEGIVPFDLREIRHLAYDPNDLTSLRNRLVQYVINGISTIPRDWNRRFCPPGWEGAYIKLTSLDAPVSVHMDQLINIRLTARNNGQNAEWGYFSVSFPDGIDDLKITSSVDKEIGQKGDNWSNGTIILKYPIAEGLKFEWHSVKEYVINVSGYARRRGIFWFYVNACTHGPKLKYRKWDPDAFILEQDQRGENVYCGAIEVKDRS
jgi:hypothetical protein